MSHEELYELSDKSSALYSTNILLLFNSGFLVDKFGKFKPVLIITLLLNAVFHHALFIIPQQEIPGVVPASYVMRHPKTGNVEVNRPWLRPKFILMSLSPLFTLVGLVESLPISRVPR